ncbi:MAG TPA: arabinan endo-1,5-alpha-L-arabinosidase [Pyrinomonadaceae bacterium]|nr:arabinan endo-1,5-alpha-L-arabinosidase [Pyrinomonadaceae bacterium]
MTWRALIFLLLIWSCDFPVWSQSKSAGSDLSLLTGDVSPVHDPSIIRQGSTYYVFGTNRFNQKLLPIFCSTDLKAWQFCGNVFDDVPDWAKAEIPGARGLWAPDISYNSGEYRLYYAVSTFGSNQSVIGLITNKTLDNKNPGYKWVDRGRIIGSTRVDDYNAIDPNCVKDEDGNTWLAFGSFWGGIKMRRLDSKTGKLLETDTKLYSLASRRPLDPPAIEGPAIIRHAAHYYLFVAFDFCCRGKNSTYKIYVGRADKITGPYLDRDGKPLMDGGGTLLVEGSENWRGPGGQSLLHEDSGDLLAFHSYSSVTGKATLMVSRITWKQGWPQTIRLP